MNDEGFREIQLNGKQLVFLFMAATVILVVSFLFGVLVGRGVHSPETVVQTAEADIGPDRTAPPPDPAPAPAAAGATAAGAPAPAGDAANLSYVDRLVKDTPAEENLKKPGASSPSSAPAVQEPVAAAPVVVPKPPPPAASKPAPPIAKPVPSVAKPAPPAATGNNPAPAAVAAPAPSRAGASPVASVDPSGPGFAVQVSIFENRQEADRLAQQLVAKGYPAFVLDPAKDAAKKFYRVRVGKYRSRQDAEEIQARLQKNEQFKPWIAR